MFTSEQYTYLVSKYIDTVFRVAFGYTRKEADAEDIVENVFLILLEGEKGVYVGRPYKALVDPRNDQRMQEMVSGCLAKNGILR